MSWVSGLAVYFIIWWTTLFVMIPLGLKTQDDKGDVTLGTVSSAPHGSHMGRAVLRTTIVSAIVFGVLVMLTRVFGLSFDDIPRVVPKF